METWQVKRIFDHYKFQGIMETLEGIQDLSIHGIKFSKCTPSHGKNYCSIEGLGENNQRTSMIKGQLLLEQKQPILTFRQTHSFKNTDTEDPEIVEGVQLYKGNGRLLKSESGIYVVGTSSRIEHEDNLALNLKLVPITISVEELTDVLFEHSLSK